MGYLYYYQARGRPVTDQDKVKENEAKEGETKENEVVESAASQNTEPARHNNRSSLIEGFFKTLEYVSKASDDKTIVYRDSDRRTTNFLGVALIGAVIFAVLPSLQLASLGLICYVVADIFLLLSIGGFVLTRFGVIRAMEPRYALVTWHLMVGTGLLTLTIGFNIVAIAVAVLMKDQIGSILSKPMF